MANSTEQTSKPPRTEAQKAAAAAMVKATAERRAKQAALKAAGGTHITREDTMRPKSWMPAQMLPEPDRQPGYEYRYIRISTLNQADPSNVSAKLREGWEPVKIEEQPQMQFLVNPNSRYKDSIEIGGLILCKTPTEFVNQRTAHFEQQTRAQTDAVDHNMMRQSDPRMPMFRERDSRTSFGKR
jgi:hypothetical protein